MYPLCCSTAEKLLFFPFAERKENCPESKSSGHNRWWRDGGRVWMVGNVTFMERPLEQEGDHTMQSGVFGYMTECVK